MKGFWEKWKKNNFAFWDFFSKRSSREQLYQSVSLYWFWKAHCQFWYLEIFLTNWNFGFAQSHWWSVNLYNVCLGQKLGINDRLKKVLIVSIWWTQINEGQSFMKVPHSSCLPAQKKPSETEYIKSIFSKFRSRFFQYEKMCLFISISWIIKFKDKRRLDVISCHYENSSTLHL